MVESSMNVEGWLRKQRETAEPDLLREMASKFTHALMDAEADAICGAAYGERSPDRVNRRNGRRTRDFDTRTGTIELAIPKLRRGSYFPDWLLTPRRRAEQALVAAIAECYVKGVSARRVDGLVKTLGIDGISKSQVSELAKSLDEAVAAFRSRPLDAGPYTYVWIDALTQKCREGGRIVNVAALCATGGAECSATRRGIGQRERAAGMATTRIITKTGKKFSGRHHSTLWRRELVATLQGRCDFRHRRRDDPVPREECCRSQGDRRSRLNRQVPS